jgi:hypothetical protein
MGWKGARTMTYGRLIEYEGQMAEAFRREVTQPAAARRASFARAAALMHRTAIPTTAHRLARLRRLATSG